MNSPSDDARSSTEYDESEFILGKHSEKRRQRRWTSRLPSPWVFSTFLFAALSMVLAFRGPTTTVGKTYETGFSTDLETLRSEIEVKTVRFTGGLKIDDNGTLYRVIDDPWQPQYVGPPSPELDAAWNKLLIGSDTDLGGSEAESVKMTTGKDPNTGFYRISLDVFHSLHCLDTIRRGLDTDYYHPNGKVPYFYRMHIDHCIDYIRQSLQCHSDLTALSYFWDDEYDSFVPAFGFDHTCRNFQKINDWAIKHSPHRQ